jgi:hypothetical protein
MIYVLLKILTMEAPDTTIKGDDLPKNCIDAFSLNLMLQIKQYILPAIECYLISKYELELTTGELSKHLNIEVDSREKCLYILDNSTIRPSGVCGEERSSDGGHFCNRCMRKKKFICNAIIYARNKGITLEEAIGVVKYREYIANENAKENTPEFVTRQKRKDKKETLAEVYDCSKMNLIPIGDPTGASGDPSEAISDPKGASGSDLVELFTNKALNFVFKDDKTVVGQWNEENMIIPLTPSSLSTIKILGLKTDSYEKYNFGKYQSI